MGRDEEASHGNQQMKIRADNRVLGWLAILVGSIITGAVAWSLGRWIGIGVYWSIVLWSFGVYAVTHNTEPNDPYANDEP